MRRAAYNRTLPRHRSVSGYGRAERLYHELQDEAHQGGLPVYASMTTPTCRARAGMPLAAPRERETLPRFWKGWNETANG